MGRQPEWRWGAGVALGAAVVIEPWLSGWGYNTQADPRLDYPPIPILERLREAPPGRMLGVRCLPPSLPTALRLPDVRGYDGVDPARYVRSPLTAADPERGDGSGSPGAMHAHRDSSPACGWTPPSAASWCRKSSTSLEWRYLVFRRLLPKGVEFRDREGEYAVAENPAALPRVFVPT